jgi:hypothetical protein
MRSCEPLFRSWQTAPAGLELTAARRGDVEACEADHEPSGLVPSGAPGELEPATVVPLTASLREPLARERLRPRTERITRSRSVVG